MYTQSSLCVPNSTLPACIPNFVEAARTTNNAEQAWFTLHLICNSKIATYFQVATVPSVLFGWKSMNIYVSDTVNHPAIRIFLFTRERSSIIGDMLTVFMISKPIEIHLSVLRNRYVHRKHQPFVPHCWMVLYLHLLCVFVGVCKLKLFV